MWLILTKQEAENLLGQAVALNIIVETCALYDDKCCYKAEICPYFSAMKNDCIFACSLADRAMYVSTMEKRALETLNKGEKNNDK